MTERNELGFVKDINVALEAISHENLGSKEKVRTVISLPFSIEDVSSINNFINSETTQAVDCNDELYNIAILNEQILEFDETLKSQLEKRHDEFVEALMNRMEGVFKMYNNEDLNQNVQPVYPTVEQPVEVQTPQIEEISPVAPVETVTPVEGYAEPVIEVPVTAPVDMVAPVEGYAEPVVEAPVVSPEAFAVPVETVEPVEVAVETPAEAPVMVNENIEVPREDNMIHEPELTVDLFNSEANSLVGLIQPMVTELPVGETYNVPEEPVTVNEYEEPVVEVQNEVMPEEEHDYREVNELAMGDVPATFGSAVDVPTVLNDAEVQEEENVNDISSYAPVDDNTIASEEDEKIQAIIDHFDSLKKLELRIYNNQNKLTDLHKQVEIVENDIRNDREEVDRINSEYVSVK